MITDQGAGFDMAAIPADRLGVRGSIVDRMDAVGGSAQIWSTPGGGTSVVLTFPSSRSSRRIRNRRTGRPSDERAP